MLTVKLLKMVSRSVFVSGTALGFWMVIHPQETANGLYTREIANPAGPLIFSLLSCWFISKVFIGALECSALTILMASACDEEMYVREQRYNYPDLVDYLDGFGEEQNEFYREDNMRLNGKIGKVRPMGRFDWKDEIIEYETRQVNSSDSDGETEARNLTHNRRGDSGTMMSMGNLESIEEDFSVDEGSPGIIVGRHAKFV